MTVRMFKVCLTTFLILAIMSFNSAASWPGHKTSDVNSYRIYPKNGNFWVSKKQKLVIDTVPAGKKIILDTLLRNISDTATVSDSLRDVKSNDTLPYRLSKNALVAPVEFSTEDSMVLDIPGRSATVYGKESNLLYKDNDVKAPVIVYDMNTGDISASLVKDSTGKVIERPSYKSGDMTTESDSFRFNMKTGKGLTKGTYTQQGEMYVYGESIKKVDNEVLFAYKGRFTTCNLDTPHFAFAFTKTKFINDKMALTGPIHPEVEGVPIPIYLPFGIYPLAQGRHSGLLAPSFVTNEQRGLGLEGLGYYKVLGEYWDFILQTSIYSYGGWSLSVNPRYSKRYRYNGSFLLNIQHFNFNFKGDPDFGTNRSFNIQWVHSTDAKSRPGVTFSGNVNAGSSSYNSYVPNNPMLNISNMMSSSIRYSKTWKGTPFNLTVAANHQQNTNLKQITLDLPTINFSMSTIYPFRKKERAGESKWYENIGFGYNMDTRSTATFYDTVKTKSIFQQIRDTVRWGARHRIPISLSLPPLGFFQVSPSVSYDETWFQVKSIHYYNPTGDTLLTRLEKGLYTARNMSFGLGASTRIFGMLMAKKKDARIIGIRHEIRPTVTASYQPDFQKRNYYFLTDSLGRKTRYAYYESRYNLNSLYSPGEFGGLNFSIENNISMKVRSRKDTGEAAIKKISIIDAFSITGSYNFLQDSFRFQPISMSASSNLFNKVSLTGFASFNLYEVNDSGRPVNRLIWKRKPISLGRLTSASLTLSSSFQGGNKKTGEEPGLKPNGYRPESGYSLDEFNQELAYINAHPGEYADFNIPWSLNFSYSLSLNRQFLMNYGFKSTVSQNLNLGGTVNLTPKWQLGLQTYYNISDGTLNPMTLSLSRDLHCWQMSVSVSSGMYRYFSINISPKAPILRDLRVNKTESFRRL